MKRWTTILVASFLATVQLSAAVNYLDNSLVELGIGYRQDNFNWSISVPPIPEIGFEGAEPLSKLDWKDLRIGYLALRSQTVLCSYVYMRAEIDYGRIWDGKTRDSDFFNIGKKSFEFSRSTSDSSKGEVWDFTAGIGVPFSFFCDTFHVTPLIGYSFDQQNLRIFNSRQNFLFGIDSAGTPVEIVDAQNHILEGVHCNYRAKWYGPWIGVDLGYDYCDYSFIGSLEYHWSQYKATGHWNRRSEFVDDFTHTSDAHGVALMLGAYYDYNDCINLGIRTNYRYYRGKDGTDITTVDLNKIKNPDCEGTPDIIRVKTPFDGARWSSFWIEGTIAYKF